MPCSESVITGGFKLYEVFKIYYCLYRRQKYSGMEIFMNIEAILVANIIGFILLLILYISRAITRIKSDTEEKAMDELMLITLIA